MANPIKRVAAAVSIGTMIEWYDFFLYGTAAALIFPKLFFPAASSASGALLSFATFATGFAARPLGGVIFGHLGDRLGRKTVLVMTLLMMGIATVAIGLLPTFGQIGIAAPILLVVLRVIQGLGTGGEWGGAALMTKENGTTRPGFWGAFLSSAVFVGLILGSLAYVALATVLSDQALLAWGWRIPFLLSIVLVAVGLQVRRTLSETEEFDQVKQARAREQSPVIESLRRPRNVIAIFLMRVGQNTTFYIVSVFVLSYATSALKLSKPTILAATVVGAVAACVLCPLYGHLGDRFGFRWVMLASLLSQAVFAFPFFLLLDSRNVAAVVIAVTIGIGGGSAAADAIQAGYFTSMFGTRIRFSAVSIGREGGTVVGGGFAPLIAAGLLAWEGGTPWAVAGWMLFTSLVGIAGIFLARPALPSEPASDPRAATAADPAGA